VTTTTKDHKVCGVYYNSPPIIFFYKEQRLRKKICFFTLEKQGG